MQACAFGGYNMYFQHSTIFTPKTSNCCPNRQFQAKMLKDKSPIIYESTKPIGFENLALC